MSNNEIYTKSTSQVTEQASAILLRETKTTRLLFRPIIIENSKNKSASLKGTFVFQRKSQKQRWADFETISLSSLKSGEGYKLELKSEELLKLIDEITPLYELYKARGIQQGEHKYIRVTPQLEQFANISEDNISNFFNANVGIGETLLSKLLMWAVNIEDPAPLIESLVKLNPASISKLNSAIGLQRLKNALSIWESNINNSNEEFWQTILTEHSYVLEQVFSWPTSIVKDKAYIGGKSVFNKSGNLVDFLMKNRLTQNAALIEIKTPLTQLLDAKYRNDVYNVSKEMSGSIMQMLNYKHSLQENFAALTTGRSDLFDSFNPQCAVIIGNSSKELDDNKLKTKSFELFRHQFAGVIIITFDELFDKTRKLIQLLETPAEDDTFDPNNIPF